MKRRLNEILKEIWSNWCHIIIMFVGMLILSIIGCLVGDYINQTLGTMIVLLLPALWGIFILRMLC